MTIPQTRQAEVMALLSQGLSYRDVASRLGMSRSRVGHIARHNGHDVAAALAQRAEDSFQRATAEPKGMCPAVPVWVRNAGLTEDYLDHARVFGEHAAARHCRQLLAEMRKVAA